MKNLTIFDEVTINTVSMSSTNDQMLNVAQAYDNSQHVSAANKVVYKPRRRTEKQCFRCGEINPVDAKKTRADNFKDYITEKEFDYLITLTAENTRPATILSDFQSIFSDLNREIFAGEYRETLSTHFLEGFAFSEYHKRGFSGECSKATVYMLIKYDPHSEYIPLTEALLRKYVNGNYINSPYIKNLTVTVQKIIDNSSGVIEHIFNHVCNERLSNVSKFGAGRYWLKLLEDVTYLLDYNIETFPAED